MGFPQKIADEVLVRCSRHCCLCGVYAGSKIELHHIKQVADGGDDSAENCIPLCLNCHAEVKAYNPHHPKGRKFTETELKGHRDKKYIFFFQRWQELLAQAYQVLHTRCSANSLLDYRCSEIHELLNDPTAIIQKFEHYTQKIRWHIQRLYRIRNEITHSAFQEDKSLVIYIEHLYTYLAQLMSEVVYYVEHKNVSTVEEAYAIILESYRTYFLDLRP